MYEYIFFKNHMCKTTVLALDEPYGFNMLMPLHLSNRPIQKDEVRQGTVHQVCT